MSREAIYTYYPETHPLVAVTYFSVFAEHPEIHATLIERETGTEGLETNETVVVFRARLGEADKDIEEYVVYTEPCHICNRAVEQLSPGEGMHRCESCGNVACPECSYPPHHVYEDVDDVCELCLDESRR